MSTLHINTHPASYEKAMALNRGVVNFVMKYTSAKITLCFYDCTLPKENKLKWANDLSHLPPVFAPAEMNWASRRMYNTHKKSHFIWHCTIWASVDS